MANPTFDGDPAAFDLYPWQALIESHEIRLCDEYIKALFAEGKRCEDGSDDVGAKVYRCLGTVCQFRLQIMEKAENPYRPLWGDAPDGPDDLGPAGLIWLRSLAPTIRDNDFRARVFDLVWVLGKDFTAVSEAVQAYTSAVGRLAAGVNLSRSEIVRLLPRIERAMQLGARFGRAKNLFSGPLQLVGDCLDARESGEEELVAAELLSMIEKYKVGDAPRWSSYAERLARRFSEGGRPNFARRYWILAQLFSEGADDAIRAKEAAIAAAETFVMEAEGALVRSRPSYGSAATFLGLAIGALRKVGGQQIRCAEIQARLLEYQRRSVHPDWANTERCRERLIFLPTWISRVRASPGNLSETPFSGSGAQRYRATRRKRANDRSRACGLTHSNSLLEWSSLMARVRR